MESHFLPQLLLISQSDRLESIPCCSRQCHTIPFLARALKKNVFFDVDIVEKKKNQNVVYRSLHSYRQHVLVITLFPNIF